MISDYRCFFCFARAFKKNTVAPAVHCLDKGHEIERIYAQFPVNRNPCIFTAQGVVVFHIILRVKKKAADIRGLLDSIIITFNQYRTGRM